MATETGDIDTSMLEELTGIKEEREVLQQRLERLEQLTSDNSSVSPEVFRRVRRDYQKQIRDLEERAAPLKESARGQYRQLAELLERAQAQVGAARSDREEVELRHRLAEFDDAAFEERLQEVDARIEELEADLAETVEIQERFVAAFDSESELQQPTQDAAGTQVVDVPEAPDAVSDDATTDSHDIPDVVSVVIAPDAESTPPEPGAEGFQTVILPQHRPRLILEQDGESSEEFSLAPLTVIGRSPEGQIRLDRPEVSRRHAQITLTPEGYVLKDLGSENGTYVNGERVDERSLADDDHVRIGGFVLVFHQS